MSNNGNILFLKQGRPGLKTWAENDIGNNIEYGVKFCQFKTTIVNYTEVQFKGLKIPTAHRRDIGIANKYVAWI